MQLEQTITDRFSPCCGDFPHQPLRRLLSSINLS
jgi:hypothetical protein